MATSTHTLEALCCVPADTMPPNIQWPEYLYKKSPSCQMLSHRLLGHNSAPVCTIPGTYTGPIYVQGLLLPLSAGLFVMTCTLVLFRVPHPSSTFPCTTCTGSPRPPPPPLHSVCRMPSQCTSVNSVN